MGNPQYNQAGNAWFRLEHEVYAALETYSNVHRGSGHNSIVTTRLFEEARNMVLEYLGLNKGRYVLIFCSPRGATTLSGQLEPGSYESISSQDIGLPLGIRALAVKKNALPGSISFYTGGGTARLMSRDWVIRADAPGRFEAGTPAIINIIAFAKALQMTRQSINQTFIETTVERLDVAHILYHDELEEYAGRELLEKLRQTHIGRNMRIPTMEGPGPYINLDNAASTPTFEPVWNAVWNTWRQPLNIHKEIILEVRSICATALGAPQDDYEVIFTSNTTEAINLVAESLGRESGSDTEPIVINTLLEHSSNDLPWRTISRHSLIRISVNSEGIIDTGGLESLLCRYNHDRQYGKKRISLVAVSGASNVLGICNDLKEIGRIVHRYGARLLVDAAQLVAHRKVDMEAWGIDFLALSAHKVYAPFGCGALVARKGLLHFNAMEMEVIHASGNENPGGIAALGKAFMLLQRIGMDVILEEEQALTRRVLLRLGQTPGIRISGIKDPASPMFVQKGGVIAFSLKGVMPDRLARELAQRRGIGVRYGCHCAHLLVKHLLNVGPGLELFQRVLLTIFPRINLPGVARVSLGIENTTGEIDILIDVIDKIARKTSISRGKKNPADLPIAN